MRALLIGTVYCVNRVPFGGLSVPDFIMGCRPVSWACSVMGVCFLGRGSMLRGAGSSPMRGKRSARGVITSRTRMLRTVSGVFRKLTRRRVPARRICLRRRVVVSCVVPGQEPGQAVEKCVGS